MSPSMCRSMVVPVRTLISSAPSDQQPRVHVRPAPKVDRAAAYKANTPSTQVYRKPREFRDVHKRQTVVATWPASAELRRQLSAFNNTLSSLVSVVVAKLYPGVAAAIFPSEYSWCRRLPSVSRRPSPLTDHSVLSGSAIRDLDSNESGPADNARSVPAPDAARPAG